MTGGGCMTVAVGVRRGVVHVPASVLVVLHMTGRATLGLGVTLVVVCGRVRVPTLQPVALGYLVRVRRGQQAVGVVWRRGHQRVSPV